MARLQRARQTIKRSNKGQKYCFSAILREHSVMRVYFGPGPGQAKCLICHWTVRADCCVRIRKDARVTTTHCPCKQLVSAASSFVLMTIVFNFITSSKNRSSSEPCNRGNLVRLLMSGSTGKSLKSPVRQKDRRLPRRCSLSIGALDTVAPLQPSMACIKCDKLSVLGIPSCMEIHSGAWSDVCLSFQGTKLNKMFQRT